MELASTRRGHGGRSNRPRNNHNNHDHNDYYDSYKAPLTSRQKYKLELLFKVCPYTDEKKRMEISRELGMQPQQVKFWFQNKRAQLKTQHERQDNSALKAGNDRIRRENVAIRESLKKLTCPNCGPPINEDSYYADQKMRLENVHLKEKLDTMSNFVSKYTGKPFSSLPPILAINISPINVSMGTSTIGKQQRFFDGGGNGGAGGSISSLGTNLRQETSTSCNATPYLPPPGSLSGIDEPLMSTIATIAFEEFMRLLHTNEPLWLMSPTDGRDVLNFETYERMFPTENTRLMNRNVRVEASRDSAFVMMKSSTLAEKFMDPNQWKEIFAPIVSAAKTIEVVSSSIMDGSNGSLQLMYEELQVLSPHVSTREFHFLRYSQEIEKGTWAIVDVSYDNPQDKQCMPQFRCHRFPSGCLIQNMPNGQSKVTWIEHVEVEDKTPIHNFFRNFMHSGMAFGADRWLAILQRMCERMASLTVTTNSTRDPGGVITSPEGKTSMLKLSQRMVTSFCASVGTSNGQNWTTTFGSNEIRFRVTYHKGTDPKQTNGVVLSAATTIWLPIPLHIVFNFFKDEKRRPQWDVLSNGNHMQEVANIANGSHPGNCISILQDFNTTKNGMLILQESCIDSSGALVVYCPIDLPSINKVMSGEDPSFIPLMPSGFSISPDGQKHHGGGDGASTSSSLTRSIGGSGGSLITVSFQILVSNIPSAEINMDSVAHVTNLINTAIHQIKVSLNCPSSS
ncbi:hypothetical protein TanjilG_13780 [Lupinus angustifolius]|uniref:Homeobox domain-containing protein n=1 Tax=Lupinus angustifolius TaxID=3871 RepID=A0A1J7G145_LUPAN|nr:PREDICTED: homeobox-leucine zipper protein HDG11-like [Lupinus angustifolius]OIV94163.1 hypothetical protein TanjilG_13780 [Lupinus angustifolius]